MPSSWLAMEKQTKTTGLLKTVGEKNGANRDILELQEENQLVELIPQL